MAQPYFHMNVLGCTVATNVLLIRPLPPSPPERMVRSAAGRHPAAPPGQGSDCSDVRESQVVEVQGRRTAMCRKLCAHMFEVFRPHVADQTNRGSVFADVGDDPERHSQGVPRPVTPCNRRTDCQSCGANNLRGVAVPNLQNLLIRQQSDGRRARVSDFDSCTGAYRSRTR